VMFGSREAVLARLYGSLDKFLENYSWQQKAFSLYY
jgi:hypothetical protein